MIYNFNHGMSWSSSGVEYAQAYRARILRNINQPAKFVFTDMISYDNIEHMAKNLGFLDDELIWMYLFFTDIEVAPTTFTLDDLGKTIPEEYTVKREAKAVRFTLPGNNNYYNAYLVKEGSECVHRVEIVRNGYLIRKDYYNYCKMYSEYYAPANNEAHLYQRTYFNEDGSLAYEELVDGESFMFKFKDRVLYSKEQLVGYMVEKMNLTAKDFVIIDRTTDIGQAILQNANDAKVGVVIHADHFNESTTDEETILWNNFYEYAFAQHERIDFYLAATDVQSRTFREQFLRYNGCDVNVVTIPVGSIDEIKYPSKPRKRHSLITASRLASEKHVDWLAQAVIKLHDEFPDVTFDIYGKGNDFEKIEEIAKKNNAENYIRLMGHKDLSNVYSQYEAYISASTGEGFGLTLLEAIAAGLPLVGFDVRYGNPNFIVEGENGFLVEYSEKLETSEKIELLVNGIRKVLEADIEKLSQKSYEVARRYMTEEVEKAWMQLLENK